mgnify:CR=1 FL=1
MKLEFKDNLKREAIDLYFNIPNVEADITVKEADITWNLNIEYRSWGLDSFQYQLNKLQLTALVETYIESEERTEETELVFQIQYNTKDNRSQIYVKYIELDLNNEEKSLKLTI